MMDDNESKLHLLTTPFIVSQGGYDKIIHPQGAFDLMKKSKSIKKDILYYPKMWHCLIYDPTWEKIIDDIIKLLPKYIW